MGSMIGRRRHPQKRTSKPSASAQGVRFVLPAVAFIFICAIIPIGNVVKLALTSTDFTTGNTVWVGVTHFVQVARAVEFWSAAWHTVRYVVLSVFLHLFLGLLFAIVLNSELLARVAKAGARSLMMLPWTTTLVVSALLWRLLLNPQFSIFRTVVNGLGMTWDRSLLTMVGSAFLGIVIANVWNFTPFYMLMILAQLQSIPRELYEAADIDGAGQLRKLLSITLPQLEELIWFLGIFDVVGTFIQFDLVWLMTNGGPLGSTEVLATLSYRRAFESFDINLGSSIGIMMVLGMAAWTGAMWLVYQRRRRT